MALRRPYCKQKCVAQNAQNSSAYAQKGLIGKYKQWRTGAETNSASARRPVHGDVAGQAPLDLRPLLSLPLQWWSVVISETKE
jgi:hypothetical protein